jgi:hypothetical protein
MDDKPAGLLVLLAAAAAVLVLAASLELARQCDRAEESAHLTEAAAWQVSQVLEEARRIAADAARHPRGELP